MLQISTKLCGKAVCNPVDFEISLWLLKVTISAVLKTGRHQEHLLSYVIIRKFCYFMSLTDCAVLITPNRILSHCRQILAHMFLNFYITMCSKMIIFIVSRKSITPEKKVRNMFCVLVQTSHIKALALLVCNSVKFSNQHD